MPVDLKLLQDSLWLKRLAPQTLDALAARAIVRRLADGELWISRADRAAGIAIIVNGGLRSTTFTEEGREYVFSIMKKGDIWGLVSTIDGIFNANDVYAYGETTILSVARQTVLKLMETHPDFTRCLMEILCYRLRMSNTVLEDRALKTLDVRLARLILSLRHGAPAADGEEIAVTQDTLAKILGCTRPTVNKQLKRLEKTGAIRVDYGRLYVVDPARIRDISGDTEYYYF